MPSPFVFPPPSLYHPPPSPPSSTYLKSRPEGLFWLQVLFFRSKQMPFSMVVQYSKMKKKQFAICTWSDTALVCQPLVSPASCIIGKGERRNKWDKESEDPITPPKISNRFSNTCCYKVSYLLIKSESLAPKDLPHRPDKPHNFISFPSNTLPKENAYKPSKEKSTGLL